MDEDFQTEVRPSRRPAGVLSPKDVVSQEDDTPAKGRLKSEQGFCSDTVIPLRIH